MAAADFRSVAIDDIRVGPRLRQVSEAHVEHIALSLTEYGRVAPIIVRPDPERTGGYLLVAGAHRLAAARKAGLAALDAEVRALDDAEARAVEIAENLYRYELTALDRAKALAALDAAVTAGRPRGRGGDRKSMANLAIDPFERLEAEVRQRIKLSGRSIRRDIALARDIDPDAARRLAHTPVADNAAQLGALARLDPKLQRQMAAAIADGQSFGKARAALGLKPEVDPEEALFRTLVGAWSRAKAKTRRRFLAHVGDDGAKGGKTA